MYVSIGLPKGLTPKDGFLFVESANDDGADVALFESALADELDGRVDDLVARECGVHSVDLRRIHKSLDVLGADEKPPSPCVVL